MKEEESKQEEESLGGEVGDVSAAGETTAADTVSGPQNIKAVGEDTMVKVEGERDPKGPDTG